MDLNMPKGVSWILLHALVAKMALEIGHASVLYFGSYFGTTTLQGGWKQQGYVRVGSLIAMERELESHGRQLRASKGREAGDYSFLVEDRCFATLFAFMNLVLNRSSSLFYL